MTALLVMFLFLAFVGTDHVVHLATRRAAVRRAATKLGESKRTPPPAYAELTKRAVG